jgi:hypothetical protein
VSAGNTNAEGIMLKINSLEHAIQYINTSAVPVYVRYAQDIEGDLERGFSRNHATGVAECGLSVNSIRDTSAGAIASSITEYVYFGGTAYLLTGRECGTGSDGEPVLAEVEILAELGEWVYEVDDLLLLAEEKVSKCRARISSGLITDKIAAKIWRESLALGMTAVELIQQGARAEAGTILNGGHWRWSEKTVSLYETILEEL